MDNEMTIITERYEYFENHRDDLIKRKSWTKKAKNIIRDAYVVDINPSWTEAQLLENRHIEVYTRIIQKCRIMRSNIPRKKEEKDILLTEQLDNLCRYYRIVLLEELTATIREYCL